MDSVRRDHHVGGGARAIGEAEDSVRVFLLETDTLVVGRNDTGRQPRREHSEQVAAIHSIEFVLGSGLAGPHRTRIGPAATKKLGTNPPAAKPERLVAKTRAAA